MKAYPKDAPSVLVDYCSSTSNKRPEATTVNDMEEEAGTERGKCPFIVHGLTGEEYENINEQYMKVLGNGFEEVYQENISLEIIRDVVRDKLYQSYPTLFSKGQNGASVSELAFKVLTSTH